MNNKFSCTFGVSLLLNSLSLHHVFYLYPVSYITLFSPFSFHQIPICSCYLQILFSPLSYTLVQCVCVCVCGCVWVWVWVWVGVCLAGILSFAGTLKLQLTSFRVKSQSNVAFLSLFYFSFFLFSSLLFSFFLSISASVFSSKIQHFALPFDAEFESEDPQRSRRRHKTSKKLFSNFNKFSKSH